MKANQSIATADTACAAVIDLDNLLHRGFDYGHRARPQADLDVLGLARMLREKLGVTCGTVCRNRPFPPLAAALWQRLGFTTISVGMNVDDAAISEAKRWVASGVVRLVLLTGDYDFADLVRLLRKQGVAVEIAAKSFTCSKRLRAIVDAFTAVDGFVRPPVTYCS